MGSSFDTTLSGLGITRAGTATTNAAATAKSSATLDQSAFLKLMTAQLKNQDPFSPVDNNQMVAQMAQMSATSGIAEMNTTMKAIAAKLNATSASDAMSYVGRTVLTEGSTAYPRAAGGIAGAVDLKAAATTVDVTITDAGGGVLKTVRLGAQKAGTVNYDWDGKNEAGDATTGPYKVAVSAAANGTGVDAASLVWAPVESVSTPATGDPVLSVTGLGAIKLSAVRSVG